MSDLTQLQRDFQRHILAGDSAVVRRVSDSGRTGPNTQLSVYRTAYQARLNEVLENDFPALAVLLGADEFDTLARAYTHAHPSEHFSLREFGRHLCHFLRTEAGYSATPVLAELAHFEWTLGEAFDAEDAPLVTEQEVAGIPPEIWPGVRLLFHPSVHRLDLFWNAPDLWQSIKGRQPYPEPRENPRPAAWLIWRRDLKTWFRSLSADEACALDLAREGRSFADICRALAELMDPEAVPLQAASMLKGWIAEGLIQRLE